ncbi:hypothetical protein NEUTE2DRAFT_124117 [Neurospora tetrasperma FGSC 2509]|nr:hypothetical protein NEUTE2DRAFT_124117 [Neurospora tetrasperma FGSC 2509]
MPTGSPFSIRGRAAGVPAGDRCSDTTSQSPARNGREARQASLEQREQTPELNMEDKGWAEE